MTYDHRQWHFLRIEIPSLDEIYEKQCNGGAFSFPEGRGVKTSATLAPLTTGRLFQLAFVNPASTLTPARTFQAYTADTKEKEKQRETESERERGREREREREREEKIKIKHEREDPKEKIIKRKFKENKKSLPSSAFISHLLPLSHEIFINRLTRPYYNLQQFWNLTIIEMHRYRWKYNPIKI